MQIAQNLYEAGRITYHRTDGVSTAPEAVEAVRRLIVSTYGGDYVPNEPATYEAKAKYAQEAHEGIRPADVTQLPPAVEGDGSSLYGLIWQRFIASQMAAAQYVVQTVPIWVGKTAGQPYPLLFQAKGRSLKFDGFLKVYQESPDPDAESEGDTALPPLKVGAVLRLVQWLPVKHHTQAPPRFTEASLVRELERLGIGRPSTYASMVQTLKERGYATLDHQRFVPTETGLKLSNFLSAYFSEFFAASYTAELEAALDTIAQGETTRLAVLQDFWSNFSALLGTAGHASQQLAQSRHPSPTITDEVCPVCGGDLVERGGAHGKFIGCMNYADCAYTRGLEHKPILLHSRTR
jgi:DNA topoisomerase-1